MADALAPTVPHAPPRERRVLRKLLRVALVLLVLLAALTWFAPAIIARTGLLNVVLAKVGADLNGTVTADSASLSWFGPVDLRGVTVTDADGNAVLTADTVSSSRTLYELLTDRGELGTFTVANPKLNMTVAGGTTNVEKLIEKYLTDATPAKPARTPVKVEVTGGTVTLREPATQSEHVLTSLELSLALPMSRAEPITLTTSAEGSDGTSTGKLGVQAEFIDGGKLKFTATSFPVGNLAPVLHRFDPTTTANGLLTANVDASWKTEADKPPTLTVDGTASATGVRLAAAWLGPDVLALQSVSAPCKLSYANGLLAVERSKIECDVGTLDFAGTLDPTADPEALADQTGLRLKARIDLARLAALMPKLLRVKAGTEIRSGTLAVDLNSSPGKGGPSWSGTVLASKLEATRAGQPVVWESPLRAEFTGRLAADKSPHFDKLEIRSDFLNVNARGELEAFDVAARADLGTLAAKLGEFADLGNWKLNGAAIIQVNATRRPTGGFALKGSVTCDNLLVADGVTLDLREPKVIVGYSAAATREKDGRVRLDTAEVGVTVGPDTLTLNLLKPVADARAPASGEASVTLGGDLARWQSRLGRLIGLPPDWTLGGTGTVTGTVRLDPAAYSVAPLAVNLTNAVLRMPRVMDLNERQLVARTDELRYDRKSKAVRFTKSEVTSATVTGTVPRVDVLPIAGGGYGVTGTASIQTQLEPLQRMLRLRSADNTDVLSGRAVGTVTLDASAADRFGFTADLTVTNFVFGPPAEPTWKEPTLQVKVEGAFDVAADALTLKTAHVERDGLAVDGIGRIGKLSTVAQADVAGTLTFDLAKLEPTLKEYLGKTAQVAGKGTKPFKLTGELAGGKPGTGTDLAKLGGHATVAWQSAKVYGFDLGPAELGATLKDGMVYMSPVAATFGGGKVTLSPGASLRTGDRFLNFAKGKVIDNARLTPAACADALGFVLPAIANAAQADGTFSFDLDSSRIPFASPAANATVTGRLTVHQANVSAGPMVSEVLQLLGVKSATVTLSRDNVVPVEFKNGRVHHRDFTMTVDGVVIKTAGSVGVDGTVKMDVEVPLTGKAAGLLPNNQRLRDALSKQSIHIPVGGTLAKPTLDANAFQGQLAKLIRDAGKDIGAGLAEDLLKKGFDKLLPPKK